MDDRQHGGPYHYAARSPHFCRPAVNSLFLRGRWCSAPNFALVRHRIKRRAQSTYADQYCETECSGRFADTSARGASSHKDYQFWSEFISNSGKCKGHCTYYSWIGHDWMEGQSRSRSFDIYNPFSTLFGLPFLYKTPRGTSFSSFTPQHTTMSTIAVRFKSVFVPSTRRASQTTASPIHTAAPVNTTLPASEPTTPIMIHSPSQAHPPNYSPTTSTSGSSTIHFVEPADSAHIHQPQSPVMGRTMYQRSRALTTSYTPRSRPRSPTTSSLEQKNANALAYVRVPVIPGYCF